MNFDWDKKFEIWHTNYLTTADVWGNEGGNRRGLVVKVRSSTNSEIAREIWKIICNGIENNTAPGIIVLVSYCLA